MLALGACLPAAAACRGEREPGPAAPMPDAAPAERVADAPSGLPEAAPPDVVDSPADEELPADEGPTAEATPPPAGETVAPASDDPAAAEVPPENRERGERPGAESAEALARRLLPAILADDPAPVRDLVFPVGPFTMLKDLPDPAAYHRRLVRWFEEDLHAKHEELGGGAALEFRGFRFGRCEWVPKGVEGNRIPYWSCRRNRIAAWTGRRVVEVEIRVLIHWGREWYVTHLGPVRR